MIQQELVEIWRRIASDLEPRLWYIVDDTEEFSPSLRVAIGLDQNQYESLLLASGIRVKLRDKRFGLYGIKKDQFDYIRATCQGQCILNSTKCKLEGGKSRVFISIGKADSKTPKQQATTYKALLRPRVKRRSDDDLLVINRLCRELVPDEEPELIVDNEANQDDDISMEEWQEQNEEQEQQQHLYENQPLLHQEQQQRRQQFEQQQLDREQQRQQQF